MDSNDRTKNLKGHKLLCDYTKYEMNLEDIGRSRLTKFEHIQEDKGPVQRGGAGALYRDPRPHGQTDTIENIILPTTLMGGNKEISV